MWQRTTPFPTLNILKPVGTPCLIVGLQVVVLRDGQIVSTHKADYEPQCVAISQSHTEVAVGGGERVNYPFLVWFRRFLEGT